jgi:WD40 repeat protein
MMSNESYSGVRALRDRAPLHYNLEREKIPNGFYSIAFSPDGKTLASASSDHTIKLWVWDCDKLMALGCNWIGDYLRTNRKVTKEHKQMCADYLNQPSIK